LIQRQREAAAVAIKGDGPARLNVVGQRNGIAPDVELAPVRECNQASAQWTLGDGTAGNGGGKRRLDDPAIINGQPATERAGGVVEDWASAVVDDEPAAASDLAVDGGPCDQSLVRAQVQNGLRLHNQCAGIIVAAVAQRGYASAGKSHRAGAAGAVGDLGIDVQGAIIDDDQFLAAAWPDQTAGHACTGCRGGDQNAAGIDGIGSREAQRDVGGVEAQGIDRAGRGGRVTIGHVEVVVGGVVPAPCGVGPKRPECAGGAGQPCRPAVCSAISGAVGTGAERDIAGCCTAGVGGRGGHDVAGRRQGNVQRARSRTCQAGKRQAQGSRVVLIEIHSGGGC